MLNSEYGKALCDEALALQRHLDGIMMCCNNDMIPPVDDLVQMNTKLESLIFGMARMGISEDERSEVEKGLVNRMKEVKTDWDKKIYRGNPHHIGMGVKNYYSFLSKIMNILRDVTEKLKWRESELLADSFSKVAGVEISTQPKKQQQQKIVEDENEMGEG